MLGYLCDSSIIYILYIIFSYIIFTYLFIIFSLFYTILKDIFKLNKFLNINIKNNKNNPKRNSNSRVLSL